MRLFATVTILSVLHAASATAQDATAITLVIEQNGREVGREWFLLRDGRGQGAAGSTLVDTTRYPAVNPTLRLASALERTPELALGTFRMDVDSAGVSTVILAAGLGARLTLRTLAKGSESGREMPAGPDVVLLDDAVFALYLQIAALATPEGRALTAVYPRTGRRARFTAKRETAAGGDLRITMSGDVTGTLLTDTRGRLRRLELPSTHTVVTRLGDKR
jgi:hypothetical protein